MLSDLLHLARNLRAGSVLAREGALALVDPSVLPPAARALLRLARMIEAAGFRRVAHRPLSGGVVAIHSGWKI